MDAAWWREYRRRNADRLRAYTRERRKLPKVRAQRHASEQRRRHPVDPLPFTGDLFDEARAFLGPRPAPGTLHQFRIERDWEDELMEATLALVEGTDPRQAVRRFRATERAWSLRTLPLRVQ